MPVSIKKEKIAQGVSFTTITDKKFKTNVLKIKLITELSENKAPLNTMVAMLIGSTNSRLKTYSEMSDRLNQLYGSSLFTDTTKSGDCQIITFSADCIGNKFTFKDEDILEQLIDIAEDCLFSPNVENGKFDKTEFALKKRDLMETIEAEINNKRGYAISQAQKSIFKDESCAYSQYGTLELVEKITSEDVYNAYCDLINTSVVEIYYVTHEENNTVCKRFANAFSKLERKPQTLRFLTISPLKEEVCRTEEKIDVKQSKVVLAFKSSSDDMNACTILSGLFGGTPVSKLFTNVREKLSLCYYCSSVYVYSKGTILADSGVENENVGTLTEEVINQLDMIKKGDFTEEELTNTKLALINNIKSVSDSPSSLIGWYFAGYYKGNIISPEQGIKDIMSVTREQLTEAANSFSLDTVYVMAGNEKSVSDEEE